VTHNSSQDLAEYWARGAFGEAHWVVVDNDSSDDSVRLAQNLGATQVVSLGRNVGFSRACNVGLQQVKTPFVGFLNPDVQLTVRGLEEIESVLRADDMLVSPQLRYKEGPLQPNGRGVPFLDHKILGRLSPKLASRVGYYTTKNGGETTAVNWLMGASVFARTQTMTRLGGWPEVFFLYYEDAELGLRAHAHGVESALIGDETWVHGWSRQTAHPNAKAWGHEIKSGWAFYRSHPELLLSAIGRRL